MCGAKFVLGKYKDNEKKELQAGEFISSHILKGCNKQTIVDIANQLNTVIIRSAYYLRKVRQCLTLSLKSAYGQWEVKAFMPTASLSPDDCALLSLQLLQLLDYNMIQTSGCNLEHCQSIDNLIIFPNEEDAKSFERKFSPRAKAIMMAKLHELSSDLFPINLKLFEELILSKTDPIAISHPSKYDVVIDDISESDLEEIGRELGYRRLQIVQEVHITYPFEGFIFDRGTARMFISLPVKAKTGPELIVNFVYNTCSPFTFLRKDTFQALFPSDSTPREVGLVNIHDTTVTASLSHSSFENIDLLGQDFFTHGGYNIVIDYKRGTFKITRT